MKILENLSTEELVELKNLSKEEIEKEIKTRFPVSEPCYILTRPCPQEISLINITEVDNSKITYDFITIDTVKEDIYRDINVEDDVKDFWEFNAFIRILEEEMYNKVLQECEVIDSKVNDIFHESVVRITEEIV